MLFRQNKELCLLVVGDVVTPKISLSLRQKNNILWCEDTNCWQLQTCVSKTHVCKITCIRATNQFFGETFDNTQVLTVLLKRNMCVFSLRSLQCYSSSPLSPSREIERKRKIGTRSSLQKQSREQCRSDFLSLGQNREWNPKIKKSHTHTYTYQNMLSKSQPTLPYLFQPSFYIYHF